MPDNSIDEEVAALVLAILDGAAANLHAMQREAKQRRLTVNELLAAAIAGGLRAQDYLRREG